MVHSLCHLYSGNRVFNQWRISRWEEYNSLILVSCSDKIFMKRKVSHNVWAHLCIYTVVLYIKEFAFLKTHSLTVYFNILRGKCSQKVQFYKYNCTLILTHNLNWKCLWWKILLSFSSSISISKQRVRNFYQQSFSERDVSFIIMQCLKVLEKDYVWISHSFRDNSNPKN